MLMWEMTPSLLVAAAEAWEAELELLGERLRLLGIDRRGGERRRQRARMPKASLGLRPSQA